MFSTHTVIVASNSLSAFVIRGCVDLECGWVNEVSQLSEFSGSSLSTDDVEPTVAVDVIV